MLTAKLAFRNIIKHKERNILIASIIIFINIAFYISFSFVESTQKNWRDFFSHTFVGTYNLSTFPSADNDYSIPPLYLPKKGIEYKVFEFLENNAIPYSKRIRTGAAFYDEGKQSFSSLQTVVGMDLNKEVRQLNNLEIIEGKVDSEIKDGALVYYESIQNNKWKLHDKIILYIKDIDGNSYPYAFTIMGVIKPKATSALDGNTVAPVFPLFFTDFKYLSEKLGAEQANEVAIWDHELQYFSQVKTMAPSFFMGEEGFKGVYGIVQFIAFSGKGIISILLILLTITTINVSIFGHFERMREIATMLALGAKNNLMFAMLLWENLFLTIICTFFSTLIYFPLQYLSTFKLNSVALLLANRPFHFVFSFKEVGLSAILIFASLLLSMIFPAMLVTKLEPREVFSQEGK